MLPKTTDVLIVGAGPAGMALAIGLAQRGVPFVIVDALVSHEATSRAAVVHARTLEVMKGIGVADRLIAQGIKTPNFRIRDRSRVLLHVDFSKLGTPMPFALMIPQDETEDILANRLAELGHSIVRPASVTGLARSPDSATVSVKTTDGIETITARLVVGADGEHSTVRDNAGIDFPGETYGSFLLADVRMDWPLPRDEVTLFFSDEGILVVAPMSEARYRIVALKQDAPQQPTIADVQAVIDARGPREGGRVTELLWGSRFRVHHKLAGTFHDGPVLLIGDAAHVHSPAGGQGMNLGLRDAAAAAEAIAASFAGSATALDHYAEVQRAAAAKVLHDTDRLTKVATLQSRFGRQVRNLVIGAAGTLPPVQHKVGNMLAGYN